jgi:hypothetical protein
VNEAAVSDITKYWSSLDFISGTLLFSAFQGDGLLVDPFKT